MFVPGSLSSLAQFLPVGYLSEAIYRCSTLRLCPQTIYETEKTARDKHSSLLRILINYGHKKFYNTGPWSNMCRWHRYIHHKDNQHYAECRYGECRGTLLKNVLFYFRFIKDRLGLSAPVQQAVEGSLLLQRIYRLNRHFV